MGNKEWENDKILKEHVEYLKKEEDLNRLKAERGRKRDIGKLTCS